MKPLTFGLLLRPLLTAVLFSLPLAAAQEAELKDVQGNTIVRYVVEAPPGIAPAGTTDPAKQAGLILCFQEHDTPTGNDLFPVRQSLWRQGLLDNYVLLAAAPQTRKFGPADHEPIQQLIAWARKTYPINPRRIYMYGKGEGSKVSMEFAMTHPNIVTAAIGYSWGAWLMPSELKEPIDFVNSAPELYLTLGRRDLVHHLSCVRDAYARLKAKGYHLIYREFDELGDRTYHPASNDDALAWATRLRNKNVVLSAAETKLLKATPAISGGYYPSLALVGGAPAGAVLRKLFESKDENVRAAAAATCSHAYFDPDTVKALARLTGDSSMQVRRTAIRALSMYANWRYEDAQKELIRLATDTAVDSWDRLNATDGLAYAVRHQVKGVRQDPAMFQALISLLRDKDEPVRATAAGVLAAAYEPGSGEGGQRKRAPDGGWDKWLSEMIASERSAKVSYDVCNSGQSGDALAAFCAGGSTLKRDPAAAFHSTMKAAELGYVPAQSAVGMMYATGKGVEQNYAEAGKWWVKAAEGGDLAAARHGWNLYRNGEGVQRNAEIANRLAVMIGEPVQTPRAPRTSNPANTARVP